MPRLFLPNIAAGVIPKDVSYPSLDIQAVVPARVSISSRTRCEKADALSSIPYSSSFRHPYFAGNAETGTCFAQSISPKKIEWLREIYLNKDGKNEGVGKTRRQYRYTALFGSADC